MTRDCFDATNGRISAATRRHRGVYYSYFAGGATAPPLSGSLARRTPSGGGYGARAEEVKTRGTPALASVRHDWQCRNQTMF